MDIECKQYKARHTEYIVIVYAVIGNIIYYYDTFGRVYKDTSHNFEENFLI